MDLLYVILGWPAHDFDETFPYVEVPNITQMNLCITFCQIYSTFEIGDAQVMSQVCAFGKDFKNSSFGKCYKSEIDEPYKVHTCVVEKVSSSLLNNGRRRAPVLSLRECD